jgi:hypothetical protein
LQPWLRHERIPSGSSEREQARGPLSDRNCQCERYFESTARTSKGVLIPTAAILGITAGLFALDPTEASYFRRTSSYHGFNNFFTGNATVVGTIVAPLSLYTIGLIRRDSKMQQTALLAGEAVADAEIVTTVFKDATKRVRT